MDAHYDFFVAKYWFGMNDLDLLSLTNPFELVNSCYVHPFFFYLCLLHACIPNSHLHMLCSPVSSSSRSSCVMNPFWMSVHQTLRTWVTISKEMRWKHYEFFSIFFSFSQTRMKWLWISNVALFLYLWIYISVCFSPFSYVLIAFPIHSFI